MFMSCICDTPLRLRSRQPAKDGDRLGGRLGDLEPRGEEGQAEATGEESCQADSDGNPVLGSGGEWQCRLDSVLDVDVARTEVARSDRKGATGEEGGDHRCLQRVR